jgi:hypothetical protein
MTMVPDLHTLEATLARYDSNAHTLSEVLHIRQTDVHAFLRGQLSPGRTEELHHQLLAVGIPLRDSLSSVGSRASAR